MTDSEVIHDVEKPIEQTMLFQSTFTTFLCNHSPFKIQICIMGKKATHSIFFFLSAVSE